MDEPLTLLLPPWLARDFDLARLLSVGPWPWAEGYRLLERFALTPAERGFARAVLRRGRLRLYRCNQRQACGDFVVVDMSAPTPGRRRVAVIELKRAGRLVVDRGGVQLRNHAAALAEVAARGDIDAASRVELLRGCAEEVLLRLDA